MAYTDKLRVVYGDYTRGVHGEGSLKMATSGCIVVLNLLSGEH